MFSYWKFKSSLLAEADFWNQLELMIKRELTGAIMGNSVTSPDGQRRTTNEAICGEFRQYFLKLFTREPGLSSTQFDTYLADFPRLSATEAAGCEGRIKEEEIRDALKSVRLDKSPELMVCPTKCTWGCRTCLSPYWQPPMTTGWGRVLYPDASPGA